MAVRDEGHHENAVDVRGITAADVSTKLSRPLGETGRTRRKAIPIAGGFLYHGGERPMGAHVGNWVTAIEGKRAAK